MLLVFYILILIIFTIFDIIIYILFSLYLLKILVCMGCKGFYSDEKRERGTVSRKEKGWSEGVVVRKRDERGASREKSMELLGILHPFISHSMNLKCLA